LDDSEATVLSAFRSSTLKIEAQVSAESMLTIYQTAQRHIPEDSILLIHHPMGEWIRISQNFYLHRITQKTIKTVNSPCGTEESPSHKSPFALADYRLKPVFCVTNCVKMSQH
jgi:hypothetical protein